MCVCVCERERESVCVCVCMREREKERGRERERESVCTREILCVGTVRVTEKFPFRFIAVPFRSYTLCIFSYRFFFFSSMRNAFCYFRFEFQLKRSSTAAAAFLFAPRAISVQRQSAITREHSCTAAAIIVLMVSGAYA